MRSFQNFQLDALLIDFELAIAEQDLPRHLQVDFEVRYTIAYPN